MFAFTSNDTFIMAVVIFFHCGMLVFPCYYTMRLLNIITWMLIQEFEFTNCMYDFELLRLLVHIMDVIFVCLITRPFFEVDEGREEDDNQNHDILQSIQRLQQLLLMLNLALYANCRSMILMHCRHPIPTGPFLYRIDYQDET